MNGPDDPQPDEVEQPEPIDPIDEALIPYLSGEATDEERQQLEARIALDADTRERAEQHKLAYELLDYLPSPGPSADFTAKTLTRIEQSAYPVQTVADTTNPAFTPTMSPVAWLFAAILAVALGYFAHYSLYDNLSVLRGQAELPLSDLRVIEKLPLYLGVDDFEFLERLEGSELFLVETETAKSTYQRKSFAGYDPEADPKQRGQLIEQFLSYPADRRDQLRELDRALHKLPEAKREEYFALLECYALWLDRLADTDRQSVLLTVSPEDRLQTLINLRHEEWFAQWCDSRQAEFSAADETVQQELLTNWRQQSIGRHQNWKVSAKHWRNLLTASDQPPWPFNEADLNQQIECFVRDALGAGVALEVDAKPEIPTSCRLSRDEVLELRQRYQAAHDEGYWLLYGAYLVRLADRYPTLPRPSNGEAVVSVAQLPSDWATEWKKKKFLDTKRMQLQSRWPDFALELAAAGKRVRTDLTPLGPCRPDQFQPELEEFLRVQFFPSLTEMELGDIECLEGVWPDYPEAILRTARENDWAVPGLSLPGKPSKWRAYLNNRP